MTQEQTQPTTPEPDTSEAGSLEAAALAFEKRDDTPQPAADEAPSEEVTPEADPNTDPDGTTEEDTGEGETEEIEFEGKTLQVPKDLAPELQKALLRQADYSRKMNDVAAKEKTYTQRLEQAEAMAASAEKMATSIAEIQLIDARIKGFDSLNWQEIRQSNPAEYAALSADLQTLRMSRGQAQYKAQGVAQEVGAAKVAVMQGARDDMHKVLSDPKTGLKGWGDKMGEELTAFALSAGVKLESLSSLTDPGMVKVLHDAKQFRDLQATKTEAKAKAKDAPEVRVIRPGASRQTNPANDAMARLRKTNSMDDAAAAFLSRMK